LYATRLDLEQNTFKNIVASKDIIKPEEMNAFFEREHLHSTKRIQIMDIKRQLDAQLEV
jgi:hypothetical protein